MFTLATVLSALELGFIYALVALALFLSFRVLNIADMTTDGAFTLGCAVSATAAKRQINQKISKSDRVINLGTACKSEILIAGPSKE